MGKPIIIQGAMKIELETILEKLSAKEEIKIDGYSFIKGKINDYPVVLSLTKIGSINSCLATYIAIKEFDPEYIINQGVAGGQNEDIHRGDIVIGTGCINFNSFESKERKIGDGSNPFEWKIVDFESNRENEKTKLNSNDYLFNVSKETSEKIKSKVHYGVLGSSDAWDKEADRIIWLNKNLKIISADMETASSYTVSKKLNIPIIGIRSISDNHILKEDYKPETAKIAQDFVYEVVKNIIKDKGNK